MLKHLLITAAFTLAVMAAANRIEPIKKFVNG